MNAKTLLTLVLATAPFAAFSATLAEYEFVDGSLSPTTESSSVEASNISSPKNYIVGSGSADNMAFALLNGGSPSYSTSAQNAITNSRYIEFTITPVEGEMLDISSLSFDYGGSAGPGRSYTSYFQVRSDIDNYAAELGTTEGYAVVAGAPTTNTGGSFSVDLSELSEFQNISTSVTFRIYSYIGDISGTFAGTADSQRLDNLTVSTAIPESSSSSLLLGIVCMMLIAVVRRKYVGLKG